MKLFKCAFLIIAILLCGCGESGGEFDAINVGKINVAYENGILKIAESRGNSSLGASYPLGGNFGEQQTQKSSFIPKISSKYKTSTAIRRICEQSEAINTRICDLDSANQTQNAESALDSANSQNLVKNKSREAQPLASSGEGEGVVREGEGSDFAIRKNPCIQAPAPSLKKNARSEKGGSKADLSARVRKEKDLKNRDSSVVSLPQNDKIEAKNGNFGEKVAESSSLDSAPQDEFADSAQKDFILFFFTSTCGVCKAQLPILEQLSTQGIKIYAILGDVPNTSKASAFAHANKISLPLFYESGARRFFTSAVGGVKGVPVMVIFKDGKIKEKFIGLTPKGTLLRAI